MLNACLLQQCKLCLESVFACTYCAVTFSGLLLKFDFRHDVRLAWLLAAGVVKGPLMLELGVPPDVSDAVGKQQYGRTSGKTQLDGTIRKAGFGRTATTPQPCHMTDQIVDTSDHRLFAAAAAFASAFASHINASAAMQVVCRRRARVSP
jgi:hypothetical protein